MSTQAAARPGSTRLDYTPPGRSPLRAMDREEGGPIRRAEPGPTRPAEASKTRRVSDPMFGAQGLLHLRADSSRRCCFLLPLRVRRASQKAREEALASGKSFTMPELPEVEAARRAVEDHCVGRKIKRAVVADDPKVIDGVSPADFQSALVGKTVVAARRKGKSMWLQLDSPPFPSFQFGMAGAVYIKGVAVTKYKRSAVKDTDEWPSKYSKVFIELENGLELSFTDKRRFARVRLLNDPTSVPPISELGPDALLEPMTIDEFAESLRKKKIAIKTLLLDQSFIAGIGNWVADEVLYQAKIHPLEPASSLSKESCVTLHKCIKEVGDQTFFFTSLSCLDWLHDVNYIYGNIEELHVGYSVCCSS
ncbi:hypothetical protein ACJRO7_025714 [Eucalyptus globulus]|uniref:Formamidopyrimidine-DNA glycosylase catalytic domain-containing protein n=1 Tax=Eucalyptus globulus TaxID=34317 RepID=A0ABD3KIE2_EUCGL